MLFAEKLIQLRKKYEMSQEELAEKVDVSRQSVSKWESGTSTPDLDKMIKLADVFEVSIDYLVNEDVDDPIYKDSDISANRSVSMEEADMFLDANQRSAAKIALGVALCIIGPSIVVAMAGGAEGGFISFNEDHAAGIAVLIMFVLITLAVGLFIMSGFELERYDYLTKEVIDLAYGVRGNIYRMKDEFEPVRRRRIVVCVCAYILGIVPIIATGIFNEVYAPFAVAFYLVIVAAATCVLVYTGVVSGGFNKLLQLGEYSEENKRIEKATANLSGAFWTAIIGIYLLYSFLTNDWGRSWIIWPVAVFLYAFLKNIFAARFKQDS